MSKKEEQSNNYMKPIILYRNKHLDDSNWSLGLDYMDFTGNEMQIAFEAGWDAAKQETIECLKTTLSLRSDVHPVASKHIIELVEREMEE